MTKKLFIFVFVISLLTNMFFILIPVLSFVPKHDKLSSEVIDSFSKSQKNAKDEHEFDIEVAILDNEKVVASCFPHNRKTGEFYQHAEMSCMQEVYLKLTKEGLDIASIRKRFKKMHLLTTFEPCLMCRGAAMYLGLEKISIGKAFSLERRYKEYFYYHYSVLNQHHFDLD